MTQQICPVCNLPMNYNTDGLAKNPKAPHWKCSNSNCKFQYDKNAGQYVPSNYVTSVWEKKDSNGAPPVNQSVTAPANSVPNNTPSLQPKISVEQNFNLRMSALKAATINNEGRSLAKEHILSEALYYLTEFLLK